MVERSGALAAVQEVRGSNPAAAYLISIFFQWTKRSGGIAMDDPYRRDLFGRHQNRPKSKDGRVVFRIGKEDGDE